MNTVIERPKMKIKPITTFYPKDDFGNQNVPVAVSFLELTGTIVGRSGTPINSYYQIEDKCFKVGFWKGDKPQEISFDQFLEEIKENPLIEKVEEKEITKIQDEPEFKGEEEEKEIIDPPLVVHEEIGTGSIPKNITDIEISNEEEKEEEYNPICPICKCDEMRYLDDGRFECCDCGNAFTKEQIENWQGDDVL